MRAGGNDCFALAEPGGRNYVDDIVAVQSRPQVTKYFEGHVRSRVLWICLEFVDGEGFVVTQAVDMRSCKKSGTADGGAVVHDLHEGIIFVGYGGVVNVEQAVGAA